MTDSRLHLIVICTLAGLSILIAVAAIFAILVVPGPHDAATAGLASAFSSIVGFFIGFLSKGQSGKPKDGE